MNEAEVRRHLSYCGFTRSEAVKWTHNSCRAVRSQRHVIVAIFLVALLMMTYVCGGAYYVADRVDKAAPRMQSAPAADIPESPAVEGLLTPTMYDSLTPAERELKVFTYLVRVLSYAIGSGLLTP